MSTKRFITEGENARIKEIEARCRPVSCGKWIHSNRLGGIFFRRAENDTSNIYEIATLTGFGHLKKKLGGAMEAEEVVSAQGELIANAQSDLPFLLAMARRLEGEATRLNTAYSMASDLLKILKKKVTYAEPRLACVMKEIKPVFFVCADRCGKTVTMKPQAHGYCCTCGAALVAGTGKETA